MTAVLLTISGDTASIEVEADPTVPLHTLVGAWAARCSTHPGEDLVLLRDGRTLLDPADTLTSAGIGYGTVVRLLTGEEAMDVLDVETLTEPTTINIGAPAASPWQPASPSPLAPPWSPPTGAAPAPRRPGPPTDGHNDRHNGTRPEPALPPAIPLQPAAAPPLGRSLDPEAGTLPPRVSTPARLGRAIRAGFSRRPVVKGEGFALAVQPKPAARVRMALRDTDRVHNLDTMIRAAPLPRCMVIAVVSPKGGAGKTTCTALLGTLFAELRRDPILCIDANPDFGNLKAKLARPSQASMCTDDMHAWLGQHPQATPAELSARLGSGPHGARYLPTPTGSFERMVLGADFTLYRELIGRLRDFEGIIVVDCGTGLLDPPVRAALEAADQILLVTDSSADTAQLVVKSAGYLPAAPTWLVANKMPAKGAMVDLDAVVAAIPTLRGFTGVPEQRLAENIVTPEFNWATNGPAAWQEPVREIAARLANSWPTLR